jgi:hypothetical protein
MKIKASFRKFLLVLSLVAALAPGCSKRPISDSTTYSKNSDDIFLITKKGEKVTGSSIKVNRFAKNNGSLSLDGKEYLIEDLSSYQSKLGYFANFKNRWYTRIHKGPVEAFTRTDYIYTASGSTPKTSAYICKNGGELNDYTTQNLYDMISDNKAAVEVFNANYNKVNDKSPWDFDYHKLRAVLKAYK